MIKFSEKKEVPFFTIQALIRRKDAKCLTAEDKLRTFPALLRIKTSPLLIIRPLSLSRHLSFTASYDKSIKIRFNNSLYYSKRVLSRKKTSKLVLLGR